MTDRQNYFDGWFEKYLLAFEILTFNGNGIHFV